MQIYQAFQSLSDVNNEWEGYGKLTLKRRSVPERNYWSFDGEVRLVFTRTCGGVSETTAGVLFMEAASTEAPVCRVSDCVVVRPYEGRGLASFMLAWMREVVTGLYPDALSEPWLTGVLSVSDRMRSADNGLERNLFWSYQAGIDQDDRAWLDPGLHENGRFLGPWMDRHDPEQATFRNEWLGELME